MEAEYMINICLPQGGAEDILKSFRGSVPFLPIGVDDFLFPAMTEWKNTLRVTGVGHFIGEGENKLFHQVTLFTEEVKEIKKSKKAYTKKIAL
jgi:hypothetical protein